MTRFTDNLYTGRDAAVSAQASKSAAVFSKTLTFTGGSQTKQFKLPQGAQNLDAKCYILANGSAATSDKITVSAGGVDLITFAAMGSAGGLLRQTTTGLGTVAVVASACANLSATDEVSAAATLLSVDPLASYQVQISFNRRDDQ